MLRNWPTHLGHFLLLLSFVLLIRDIWFADVYLFFPQDAPMFENYPLLGLFGVAFEAIGYNRKMIRVNR